MELQLPVVFNYRYQLIRKIGEGGLAEVVDQQRREHEGEPADADGALAEVAHVGVERLRAGDRQEHRAQHGRGEPGVARQQLGALQRIERQFAFGVLREEQQQPLVLAPRRRFGGQRPARGSALRGGLLCLRSCRKAYKTKEPPPTLA